MSDGTPPLAPLAPEPPPLGAPPPLTAEPPPYWGFRDVALFVIFIIPSLVLAVSLVKAVLLLTGWSGRGVAVQLLAIQFVLYAFWFFSLFYVVAVRYQRPFWTSMAWVRGSVPLPTAAMWGVLTAAATIGAGVLLKAPPTDQLPIYELLKGRLTLVIVSILAVTVGPVFEEITFRGFLLPVLKQAVGTPAGILLSALPFALLHGPQYGWAWQQVLMIIVVGCVFGWMRVKSGSTLTTTVMHGGYNLVFTVLLLAGVREIDI